MGYGLDFSVIVADPNRLQTIRTSVPLPGRVLQFTSGNIGSAMESIRAYRPKVVAIDAVFAQTPPGAAFADRVEEIPGITVRLIVRQDGKWTTTGRAPHPAVSEPAATAAASSGLTASEPAIVLATIAPAAPPANTRRAPRFKVLSPLGAIVESGPATLIDLSIHGAQLVSVPALRPNQRIKLGLADTDDVLNLTATVAWSCFERDASSPDPIYRVGLEFTGAAQKALDTYRQRYCAENPIPPRF